MRLRRALRALLILGLIGVGVFAATQAAEVVATEIALDRHRLGASITEPVDAAIVLGAGFYNGFLALTALISPAATAQGWNVQPLRARTANPQPWAPGSTESIPDFRVPYRNHHRRTQSRGPASPRR